MFDISWTEFLLIGVIALIVIGPKELPAVMRTLGQWTRKVRGMAADFQNQFQEAMREAEMADLKKQVDDMAQDVTEGFTKLDPVKSVRESVESIGKDFEKSLGSPAEEKPVEVKPEQQELGTAAAPALPEPDAPAPAIVAPTPEPATAAAAAAEPASTERTG